MVKNKVRKNNAKNCEIILDQLAKEYPSAKSELDFTTPFECLIATMLSAQCTDQRVNMVTKELFAKYKNPKDYLNTNAGQLEKLIKSCNYYKTKSKHIIEACKILVEKHDGTVPNSRDTLMELPGVGRKTANVVLSNAFGLPAIAVDTHVFRVSNRIGIIEAKDPLKAEEQLMQVIKKNRWSDAHHWLILHGRRVCKARKPSCEKCIVSEWCVYYQKINDGGAQ
ncbi:endonuclease III [Tindallia californiensis]|uniref:Endonuclease III n=1 Tax=Tindallia californiensis TaxID=159292 RepID=A0A1H3IAV5_9FIRM|nr:endonuclease III [Tindallia californiensis]SDY24642.1 DNA-(apurinic or apyrimidinic site) lyase /endonuclease III [Tindallia californiensis]